MEARGRRELLSSGSLLSNIQRLSEEYIVAFVIGSGSK
jgi:hypothetical protein